MNTLVKPRLGSLIQLKAESAVIYRYLSNGLAESRTVTPGTIFLVVNWKQNGNSFRFHLLLDEKIWHWQFIGFWPEHLVVVGPPPIS